MSAQVTPQGERAGAGHGGGLAGAVRTGWVIFLARRFFSWSAHHLATLCLPS